MANHPSAWKRERQRQKRQAHNRSIKSGMRTQVKKLRALVGAGDAKGAAAALR